MRWRDPRSRALGNSEAACCLKATYATHKNLLAHSNTANSAANPATRPKTADTGLLGIAAAAE